MNKYSIAVLLALAPLAVNANVIRTINGTTYEFFDIAATNQIERMDMDALLLDSNSSFYGYEYASRKLVEELLLSYASWNGVDGYYGDSGIVSGVNGFISDFGYTNGGPNPDGITISTTTTDGYSVTVDYTLLTDILYGKTGECGVGVSCSATQGVYFDTAGNAVAAAQWGSMGWNHAEAFPTSYPINPDGLPTSNSLLVRTVVPVPAAVWLFGSALLSLGLRHRKRAS